MKLNIWFLSLAAVLSQTSDVEAGAVSYDKVPVDLFVMSKCPDAKLCESVFGEVIEKVGEIVDMRLNFIGNSVPSLSCKHGPSECTGNIQEICAKKVSPTNWYKFVLCLNQDLWSIGQDADHLASCLAESNIPVQPFNECLKNGSELLKANFNASQSLNIKASCTIHINHGQYKCVHNGIWQNCPNGHTVKDFIRQICSTYPSDKLPEQCKKASLE